MKILDINKKFTEKVAKYIARGYIINAPSMAGSQGEEGKIDLVRGKELIRIWLEADCIFNWSDPDAWHDRRIILRVSVWNHPYDSRRNCTVWMNELTHIEEEIFYEIDRDKWYLSDLDEAKACVKKHNERRFKYSYGVELLDITSDKSKDIASKYLKNHEGYQRVSRDKIHVHKRVFLNEESAPHYIVKYNDTQIYKLS